jgi:hypothetical protein
MSLIAIVAAAAISNGATCLFDDAPPEPCVVTFKERAGATELRATGKSGKRVTFTGTRNSGWWSGMLDGSPAMGFELNRGNISFSTRTLSKRFQYFTPGSEHGTY